MEQEYIEIYEGLKDKEHLCICLLNEAENGGVAKLQICTDEVTARELATMLGHSTTINDDEEILRINATIELQVVFDKPQKE